MQHILVHSKMNGLRPLLTAPPVFAFRQLRGNFHDLHKRLPGTYRVYLSRLLQSRYPQRNDYRRKGKEQKGAATRTTGGSGRWL